MPCRWICVALFAVAACRGGDKAPDCETTLTGSVERILVDAKRSMTGSALARAEAMAPRLGQLLYASCVADSWSPEALRCFGAAGPPADLDACTAKLTHEQYERVHKKIDPLLAPKPAPVVVVDPPPVSDTGSGSAVAPSAGSESGSNVVAGAGAAHREPVRPRSRPTPPPARDCSKVVVDPADAGCRRQYCERHPDDLRCTAE